jgi:hypothetical protein
MPGEGVRLMSGPWGSKISIRHGRISVVLVDQPTQHVPSADLERIDRCWIRSLRFRRRERDRAMRSVEVVVLLVGPEDPIEMPAAEDERPVQALGSDRLDEALGERVRVRCPDRGEDHLRSLRAEDLIKGSGELRVTVTDQEPNGWRATIEIHGQVPGLLGHPCGVRMSSGGGEEHPSSMELDEHEHV